MKQSIENLLKKRIKRKRIELVVAFLGYLIGIGLGLYSIVWMVLHNSAE
jgi:hypothetical protein